MNLGAGALGLLDDFLRRGIQGPVIIGLHANPNSVLSAHAFDNPNRT